MFKSNSLGGATVGSYLAVGCWHTSCLLSCNWHGIRWHQYDGYRDWCHSQRQLFTWLQNHRSDYSDCPLYQHWTMVTQCYLSTWVSLQYHNALIDFNLRLTSVIFLVLLNNFQAWIMLISSKHTKLRTASRSITFAAFQKTFKSTHPRSSSYIFS